MNEFSYGQALLFYKDEIEELEKRENIKIIFEQDEVSSHTSKTNKFLLNKLFKEDGCQNPPNSPDLVYPIENIWAIIKPRIKRQTQNQQKYKILELKGGRIEQEFKSKQKNREYLLKKPIELQKQRVIYNNQNLIIHKQREIKALKKEIKQVKKNFLKRCQK